MRRAMARALGWSGVRLAGTSQPTRLRVALWLQRRAVLLAGRHSKEFPLHLSNLGVTYEQLHRFGEPDALTRMIAAHSAALQRIPSDHPARVTVMSNLGSALLERFELHEMRQDLDRSHEILKEALAACPSGHVDRVAILVNTVTALSFRLDRFGDQDAGREGAALCAEASAGLDAADPLAADVQTIWGQLLQGLAEATGSGTELDAAISHLDSAVVMAQESRGDVPHARTALARALRLRADRYGRLNDLTCAIWHIEAALAETPPAAVGQRLSRRATLAVSRATRFQWTKDPADIDEAISLFEQLSEVDAHRAPRHRANLAVCLVERSATADARSDDLDRAIDLLHDLTGVSNDSASGPALWAALADALLDRAEKTESLGDLTEAEEAANEAVVGSAGSPALVRYLGTLGETKLARFHAQGEEPDLDAALRAYADAFAVASALPRERVRAALLWGHCAAIASRWSEALRAHDHGHSLVPRLLAPDLLPTDALRMVEDLAEAGPDALALSLLDGRPDLALLRAEQWRGLVLGPDRARRQLWMHLLRVNPHLGARLQSVMARSEGPTLEDILLLERRPW